MTEGFAAVRRSHKIVELLAGRFFDGMSNKEIAHAIGTTATNVSRDMALLEDIGYARKLENGRWGLTIKPLSVMRRFTLEYERTQEHMRESMTNIESGARRLA